MSDAQQADADPDVEPGESPKEVYERVLATLEQQVGGPEDDVPAAASTRHLKTVCCSHGDIDPDAFRKALKKAVDNDDVFCYQRHDGYRFLPRETEYLLGLLKTWRSARHPESTDDLVVGLIETVVEADDFDEDETQEILAAANETRRVLAGENDDGA